MELSDQIAGIVHDVKNQLQLLSPSVSMLCENDSNEVRYAGALIDSTLDGINRQLVLLLGIYRMDEANLFSQEECYLVDVLDSLVTRVSGCACRVTCPDDLTAFCDVRLVTAVLGDALHNALRHSDQQLVISAQPEGKGVLICIEDDGPGLSLEPSDNAGLGLLLASKVASAHRNGQIEGYAKLRASSALSGACFELFLP